MAENVSDFIIRRLYEWGVRRIYGYPGDGINGLIGALQRFNNKIDFNLPNLFKDVASGYLSRIALSVHPAAAAKRLRHIEYFHDHVRIEKMLFNGIPPMRDGALVLTHAAAGNGLTFNRHQTERYKV